MKPGERFGPYEILTAIGAGGKSEVYRAHGLLRALVGTTGHGAVFDVTTGEVIGLPAPRGVASYPVRVEGDDVEVEIRRKPNPRVAATLQETTRVRRNPCGFWRYFIRDAMCC